MSWIPCPALLLVASPAGTHYLRGVNNARQPWRNAEGRLQYGLRPANPTEEGLASLHSVLFRKHPFLWRAALLYYTIHRAAAMSFRQLFQDLARYVQDANVRWEYCVRAKRGQTDTSQPGGHPAWSQAQGVGRVGWTPREIGLIHRALCPQAASVKIRCTWTASCAF